MDLRVVKTEKLIRETFLEMRKELPLEKIRVKEICDRALINKSTFYKHYSDVFDLSDKMENEFIARLLDIIETDSLFRDPASFLDSIDECIKGENQEYQTLFRDRLPVFWQKIGFGIIEHYRETGGEQYATAMLFVLGGLSFNHLLFDDNERDSSLRSTLRESFITYIRAIGDTLT